VESTRISESLVNHERSLTEMKKNEKERLDARLSKINKRLLVFSGKGGVGKSTVSANLALALAQKGMKVGLLDVDIHGPDLALMLGVEGRRLASVKENSIMPYPITGNLKLVSMSFLLESPDKAVIWRGPLKMTIIQQFLADVEWGKLDWLIIDSPPGTGDEPLSVAQLVPATGAIIVTTPQEVSLLDSKKAVSFARAVNLKVVGIVENMSGLVCPHCGERIDLFSRGGGEKAAKELGVPFLGRIPIDPRIVESGDSGKPFILSQPESEAAKAFDAVVDRILEQNQSLSDDKTSEKEKSPSEVKPKG
jgi:ATP-binding protein involved in chromosome partitioning